MNTLSDAMTATKDSASVAHQHEHRDVDRASETLLERDMRLLREQIRVADSAFQSLHERHQIDEAKLGIALEALRSIALPALGGKVQQYTAQHALKEITKAAFGDPDDRHAGGSCT